LVNFIFKGAQNGRSCWKLCDVYLLYFDELLGHIPLLICPDEPLKKTDDVMHFISFHPIWFLNEKSQDSLNRIDLEYNEKMYFAKRFFIKSLRKKRRAGLEQANFEKIVLILVLPADLDIFGGALLNKITEKIMIKYENSLPNVIESEIVKKEILKTDRIKEIIRNGDLVRNELKNTIENVCKEYFSSVIKQKDATTIKLQKAISFLSLKGFDISYIASELKENNFSNIRLFNHEKKAPDLLKSKENFKILDQVVNKEYGEFEILVINQSETIMDDLSVKITYIEEFFEKIIFNEIIDKWLAHEELMFTAPIVSNILNYLFLIADNKQKRIKFSRKITLDKDDIS
jgi:hypothetical protein